MPNAFKSTNKTAIIILLTLLAAFILLMTPLHAAEQAAFENPKKALEALIDAVKAHDRAQVLAILGDDAKDLVSSGDSVADEQDRTAFLNAYGQDHKIKISKDGDGEAIIMVGHKDWPLPIPLVRRAGGWQFDAAQGRKEILFRRIGGNELDALLVLSAYFDAQNEYAQAMKNENGKPFYAQRVVSSEGRKDGLYWPASAGEPQSPMGELMAQASADGYGKAKGGNPYHGYYYKILTRQGASAKGGTLDYVAHGKMIGGFALLAWPAVYGNSGIMSFMINHDGDIYQRDLGSDTAQTAAKVSSYNPGPGWTRVTESGQ